MSLVHSLHPCDAIATRYGNFRVRAAEALDGRIVAAASRITASAAFVAFLFIARPTAAGALVAGLLAIAAATAFPILLRNFCSDRFEAYGASAIVFEGADFAHLDRTHGPGASDHAFRVLRRSLEAEATPGDFVVQMEGAELVLLLDETASADARSAMARVERRFRKALNDAGYDCDLDIDLLVRA